MLISYLGNGYGLALIQNKNVFDITGYIDTKRKLRVQTNGRLKKNFLGNVHREIFRKRIQML